MRATIGSEVGSVPVLSAPTDLFNFVLCTGELPLEIIRMKAKGIIPAGEFSCGLVGNKGFTLPSNISKLGDDITKLDLSFCSLTGPLSIRTERLRVLLIFTYSAGELPKQLGQLTKLTHLDVSENELTGALSTRSERVVLC